VKFSLGCGVNLLYFVALVVFNSLGWIHLHPGFPLLEAFLLTLIWSLLLLIPYLLYILLFYIAGEVVQFILSLLSRVYSILLFLLLLHVTPLFFPGWVSTSPNSLLVLLCAIGLGIFFYPPVSASEQAIS